MSTITDHFDRADGPLGNGWTDGKSDFPNDYEPLGILSGAVVVAQDQTRPGTYDLLPEVPPNPPANGQMWTAIGCAYRDFGTRTVTATIQWPGLWDERVSGLHVEASPLLHVTPGDSRFGFGVWISGGDIGFGFQCFTIVGYLGRPPELFSVDGGRAMPEIVHGESVAVTLVSDGTTVRYYIDGVEITTGWGPLAYPFVLPAELRNSTVHGFALDAHMTDTAHRTTTPGVSSVTIGPSGSVPFGAVPKKTTWITRSGTTMLRLEPVGPRNLTLPPVIVLHGWSHTLTGLTLLDNAQKGPVFPFDQDARAIDALIATGRTVYRPYTGANWGTNTTDPSNGGTGRDAIDHCLAQAAADGITETTVDLWGTSAGACTALNWAWRNAAAVHGIFLSNPAFDLVYLYDRDSITSGWGIGNVSASLRAVHGGANKPAWLPLSAAFDPYRNSASIAPIAGRTAIFSARDDEVVLWATLQAWCTSLGITLTPSAGVGPPGGGHLLAPSKAGWNDFLPLRHFQNLS